MPRLRERVPSSAFRFGSYAVDLDEADRFSASRTREGAAAAASAGAAPSANIFTEEVDQATLSFTAAVRDGDQPSLTRSVLFANRVLTKAAHRRLEDGGLESGSGGGGGGAADAAGAAASASTTTAATSAAALHFARSGDPSAMRGALPVGHGAPSLKQWADALETLTTAALPTAFQYLRERYDDATVWNSADRACALAVLNLIFFTLVLCRQLQRQLGATLLWHQRRLQHQQRMRRHVSLPGTAMAPFLAGTAPQQQQSQHAASASTAVSPQLRAAQAEVRQLDALQRRLDRLYEAQQHVCLRHICFIAWNAEAQLHAVKVQSSVILRGMPNLLELPRAPRYLSEHDGWIWLWVVVLFHATHRPPAAPAVPPPPAVASTPSSSSRSPVAGPPMAGPATASSPDSAAQHRHLDETQHADAAPDASLAAPPASPPRSAVTRVLQQLFTQPGGDLHAHRVVATQLAAFDVYVRQWVAGTPVVRSLLRDWAQRTVHSRLRADIATPSQLRALFELIAAGNSLEELMRVVVTLDDLVVHLSPVFFAATRPLLKLHQLLEQLVPLQLSLLLLCEVHPGARAAAAAAGVTTPMHELDADDDLDGDDLTTEELRGVGGVDVETDDVRSTGLRSRRTSRNRARMGGGTGSTCTDAALRFCDAVSRLLAHVAELLLEPRTQRAGGFGILQFPQSTCLAMLKSTVLFVATETVMQDGVLLARRNTSGGPGIGGGGGGGVDAAAAATAGLRKRWRWWSVWTNTAHYVCVTGGRFGEQEESEAELTQHRRSRDAFFVQALALALEDAYALLAMVAATEHAGTRRGARVLHDVFTRLRVFFLRLHEEHLAAIQLHIVSPFSALGDDTFNAFAQLLEHYVAVTAAEAPGSFATTHGTSGMRFVQAGLWAASAPLPTSSHRALWLLAVAYLRLATIDSAAGSTGDSTGVRGGTRAAGVDAAPDPLRLSTPNFVCATPYISRFCLRDRTYECTEDWVHAHAPSTPAHRWQRQVPQTQRDLDAAHLFRCFRGEVQQNEDAARELLLLAAVRFLAAALRAAAAAAATSTAAAAAVSGGVFASDDVESLGRSASSYPTCLPPGLRGPAAESQASVYVSAFARYLCLLKDVSSPCLLLLLRAMCAELRSCHEQHAAAAPPPSVVSGAGETAALGEQDLHDARTFGLEVSLYSV